MYNWDALNEVCPASVQASAVGEVFEQESLQKMKALTEFVAYPNAAPH
jgi:hypothetical protein